MNVLQKMFLRKCFIIWKKTTMGSCCNSLHFQYDRKNPLHLLLDLVRLVTYPKNYASFESKYVFSQESLWTIGCPISQFEGLRSLLKNCPLDLLLAQSNFQGKNIFTRKIFTLSVLILLSTIWSAAPRFRLALSLFSRRPLVVLVRAKISNRTRTAKPPAPR